MKLMRVAATVFALTMALPTLANAAFVRHHGYYGASSTAAAAQFQDQFRNTY